MNRADLLTAALDAVNARPKTYGPPERNFDRIASLWSAHTVNRYGEGVGLRFDAVDVACMMALMKIARLEETPDHMDSWTDLAGYAACGAECATTIEHDADEVAWDYWYGDAPDEAPVEPAPRFKAGDEVTVADMTGKFWIHRVSSVGTYSIADQYGSIFHDYDGSELTPA